MTIQPDARPLDRPLRLWPGVLAVAVQWLPWLVLPLFIPDAAVFGVMAGVAGGAVVLIWWLFFSRAAWSERLGALAVMILAVVVTKQAVHQSIANGMMGMMLPVYSLPVLSLALVTWAGATRRMATNTRRAAMVGAIGIACGVFLLVRTGGISGDSTADLHWRWTQTPEERLLAQAADEPAPPPPAPAATIATPIADNPSPPSTADLPAATPVPVVKASETPIVRAAAEPPTVWPGFRGPGRDSIIPGVQIETDWAKSPPVELWRRKIGPGWSSFSIRGDLLYTQEQRGNQEDVSAYNWTTGTLVWRHRDAARFWESNGGAGPRGTPTVSHGRVYSLGATGIVNALDATSGASVWSRNAAADTGAPLPGWGFSSSPLVVDDLVIVAASGRLVAYDMNTGNPRWTRQTGGGSYSSPQVMTMGGVAQVVLLNGAGVMSVAPDTGAVLWQHEWAGTPIVQPAATADGDLLVTTGDMAGGAGTRRLAVTRGPAGWAVAERWTSRALKPYFNDYVVHNGLAFGFDGSILACIDLADGTRKWKGGRYGHGQLMLLPDQDVLLVLSEEGELALVKATGDQYTELARVPGIEGKTWNHPALVNNLLLVRNGEEMAAFRLSPAAR